jgi:hypothetical protein
MLGVVRGDSNGSRAPPALFGPTRRPKFSSPVAAQGLCDLVLHFILRAQHESDLDDLYEAGVARTGNWVDLLRYLASIAADRNCGRLEWIGSELERAGDSPRFGMGAVLESEWTKCRLAEGSIRELAPARDCLRGWWPAVSAA